MCEPEFRSVQKIASRRPKLLHEGLIGALAIHIVANYRMSDCTEENTDLMGAAGLDLDLQK